MAEVGYFKAMINSGPRVWVEAALEVVVVVFVSMIPLFGAAVREVLPKNSQIYLGDSFEKAFLGGQLIFYALGFIATIVWNSNKDFKSFFPLRTLFNVFSITSIVMCSIIVGYDPSLASVNPQFLAQASVTIFLLSLALYFLMSVITQVHVNVGKSIAETDESLRDAVRQSRGL